MFYDHLGTWRLRCSDCTQTQTNGCGRKVIGPKELNELLEGHKLPGLVPTSATKLRLLQDVVPGETTSFERKKNRGKQECTVQTSCNQTHGNWKWPTNGALSLQNSSRIFTAIFDPRVPKRPSCKLDSTSIYFDLKPTESTTKKNLKHLQQHLFGTHPLKFYDILIFYV